MNSYIIEITTDQNLSDDELDDLRQHVVDWMTIDGDESLSVTVTETD